MNFSIIIPTVDNFNFLKLTINSIIKNSKFNHEIIVSLIKEFSNEKEENFFRENSIKIFSNLENKGMCSSVNSATNLASNDYIVLSDDDMYYLPNWDKYLIDEILSFKDDKFYLSSTMIQNIKDQESLFFSKSSSKYTNHIYYDAGDNPDNFDEEKILRDYHKLEFYDWTGTHHTPAVLKKDLFNSVGRMSEEFNPAAGSDPDLCLKLWKSGVRIFKGVNKSRVYHFGSTTTRKRDIKMNNGRITFLKKWGITIDFFTKHYLKRGRKFKGKLVIKKNFTYFLEYILCKLKLMFIK